MDGKTIVVTQEDLRRVFEEGYEAGQRWIGGAEDCWNRSDSQASIQQISAESV